MFLGHPNFSSWLTAKLLAKYGRKRFKIQNKQQRQDYISAHYNPETKQWQQPIDLKRVSFTNLSIYNTEYSVFKYLLETELDVLQKAPYNQLTIYTEIINYPSSDTFINPIDANTFLVGIYTGRIQKISNLFLTTDTVTKILEPLNNLSQINEQFLKSFAMELAVKASIYNEFAKIFNQHPVTKRNLKQLTNKETISDKYKNDCLVGEFLTKEIQTRTKALVESAFFEEGHDADTLINEMLQLCIASLYVYYVQQSQETDELSAAERVFCTFNALTEKSQSNTQLMLETMNRTHPIMESEGIEHPFTGLYTLHETFSNEMRA
ncbi:MAG: hypothetical protein U9R28_01735 [Pseudomonadota bacterium]|nr:hypothetical protein [Pseudomonadota bacterium]